MQSAVPQDLHLSHASFHLLLCLQSVSHFHHQHSSDVQTLWERRSLPDEHEEDPMDVAALGAVLLSELGESAPPADAREGGEAAKEGDLLAMQRHVEALQADVARGFDQLREQLSSKLQSSYRIQLAKAPSQDLLPDQPGDGQEEARRGAWEQVLMQVGKVREEAERERAEVWEVVREVRREIQLLRAARGEGR
ncbi:unnamed protein product [Closterium sp. Naga37s-1]|nr:unnamed protein product [Closterium sp. Naga37s-1]